LLLANHLLPCVWVSSRGCRWPKTDLKIAMREMGYCAAHFGIPCSGVLCRKTVAASSGSSGHFLRICCGLIAKCPLPRDARADVTGALLSVDRNSTMLDDNKR